MTSKIKRCLLLVTVFVFVLCGCASEPDARDVYEDYLKIAEVSLQAAISKHCHYERNEVYHMAMECVDHITSYEIERWEQLSENLWVARLKHTCFSCDEMVLYATNFVGLIHGTYKVMISVEEIPDFLTEGLDLEEFYLERIDPEDGSIIHV